ncbi:MAG: MFS transporter [Nitriliruptorales bacterium]|nr:MFS transporter [Nitriliruptorales bacterium]
MTTRVSTQGGLSSTGMIVATIGSVTLSVMPAFLVGGLAVLVRRELGLSEAQLGLAVSAFYASSALTAVWGGHLTERLGPEAAMGVAAVGSGASLLATGALARSWWSLVVFLALGGVANSIAQPATNLGLARRVRTGRLGIAFGIKQTNGPVATLIAGLAVPVVGLTLGWRWAFGLLAAAAVGFALVVGTRGSRHGDRLVAKVQISQLPMAELVMLAFANVAGTAAAAALITFYVESLVASGIDVGAAGLWFAVGSVVGTGARVTWGHVADRGRNDALGQVVTLQLIGVAGYVLFALTDSVPALVLSTFIAFAAGWGWFGLLLLAVVQRNPRAPGAASGIVNAGVSGGGIIGPPAFGWIVERSGYPAAWLATAGALLVAAAFTIAARRRASAARDDTRPRQ